MPRKTTIRTVVLGLLVIPSLGCATILTGTTQETSVTSEPSGAGVGIDGAAKRVARAILKFIDDPSATCAAAAH